MTMRMRMVYLDWNVFQYLKNNKNNNAINELIGKEDTFVPFTIAHIDDFAHSCTVSGDSNSYIADDIKLISEITKDIFLLRADELESHDFPPECVLNIGKGYLLIKGVKPSHVLDYINTKKNQYKQAKPNIQIPEITPFHVDMSPMDIKHPLYQFLVNNEGVMDRNVIKQYFDQTSVIAFFGDKDIYKDFRTCFMLTQLPKFRKNLQISDPNLYKKTKVILDCINERNLNILKVKFASLLDAFSELRGTTSYELPLKIQDSYFLLDFLEEFKEPMPKNKNNKLENIRVDFLHAIYALNSSLYINAVCKFYW